MNPSLEFKVVRIKELDELVDPSVPPPQVGINEEFVEIRLSFYGP